MKIRVIGDLHGRDWWPRTDTESRIKAFDKLIDYYNPKGV